ncbi:MAG: ArnT family glycosyltransferase [Acidobacteriaceae bacterium]
MRKAVHQLQSKHWLLLLWALIIVAFAILHLVHLRADFQNYSPWMDPSKYTDEGWWGNAAIQSFVRGSWFVPGDLNTAVVAPIWPLLEWVLFHFTGVSIQAARALAVAFFFCNLLLTYTLIRSQEQRWVALLASSLIATSAFLFCFSRLAILEPLLTCLALASLILAQRVGAPAATRARQTIISIALGALFVVMVLSKTTAIFLLPAILYSLAYPLRKRPAALLRCLAFMGAVAGLLWGSYYVVLVQPHYLADYKYFFSANHFPQPNTILGWCAAFLCAMHGLLWIDKTLVLLGVALVAASLFVARLLWRNPTFVSSLFAIFGYVFFIGYHNNMQPRYYAVVAAFIFLIVVLAAAALLRKQRTLGIAALVVIIVSASLNGIRTVRFVCRPEYTFVHAAENLTHYIDNHPNGNRLLLSISGNDITLITGLPSICDDYGTMDLPDRIRRYQPGWYAAWNELDPGTLQDLHTQFSLERVASFRAFDDPDRNLLILYKLHPRSPGS